MSAYVATAIKMKRGSENADDLLEIDQIYLDKNGWFSKAAIHEHVKQYPGDVVVENIYGPEVIPCVSMNGEKYVKSTPNNTRKDNLLALPRYK